MSIQQKVRHTLATGFALALLLTVFLGAAVMVVPIYDMQLYDRVMQSRSMDTLALLSLFCVVGLGLYGLLEYLRSACFIAIAETVGQRLHGAVLDEGVRRAAAGDMRAGPELVRDLNTLQGFLSSGAVAVPLDALCAPLFLAVLFMLHPAFGYIGLAGIAALVLIGLMAEWLVRPALLEAQDARTAADAALSRAVAEPEMADGLGMLPALAQRWAVQHGQALTRLDRAGGRAIAMAGLSRLLRMVLQAGVIIAGALLVLAGATTPGSLMGANLLMGRVLAPFDQLVGSWRHWATAHAAWRRMNQLLSTPAVPSDQSCTGAAPGLLVRDLTLRTVGGQALVSDVTIQISPGTLVVVTGPNGAGKTTLLRLLAGVVPPTSGTVLLDGMRAGGVGWMPQSVSLLDGTIAENIGQFRSDALDDTVIAARRADVHDLVGRMSRGYGTALGVNGLALSGGMKQRVGLARALLGMPRLLVLDEPDASLDADGGNALLHALRDCCAAGAIAVVTSHRPMLRDAADLVLTLRDGRLVETSVAAPALCLAATA